MAKRRAIPALRRIDRFQSRVFLFFFPFLSSVSFEESSNNDSFIIRNRNCESLVRIFWTIVTIKLLIKLLIENLSFPFLSLSISRSIRENESNFYLYRYFYEEDGIRFEFKASFIC